MRFNSVNNIPLQVELDEDEPVPEADPTDTEELVEVDTY